jgi:hypothetical protein
MELQSQLTALEEEVGMLKGEIKAILQEVRVAILARQNPFLSDDLDRPATNGHSINPFDFNEVPVMPAAPAPVTPASAPAPAAEPQASAATAEPAPRVVRLTALDSLEADLIAPRPAITKRPIDLAALMVWVQDCADSFNHTEFVMLVTMASYADYFDEGLKQALVEMSSQIAREHTTKPSLADFSLALKKLEAIRATASRQHQAA